MTSPKGDSSIISTSISNNSITSITRNSSNIKVAVRLRPFNKKELDKLETPVVDVVKDQVVLQPNPNTGNSNDTQTNSTSSYNQTAGLPPSPVSSKKRETLKTFRFDHCYRSFDDGDNGKNGNSSGDNTTPFASQEHIFNQLGKPLIDHAFDGFNNCIFAYGQTGSGKSYTMMGSESEDGLIPRIGQEIFERISQLIAEAPDENKVRYSVEVSYLEIYNEKVRDLLNPHKDRSLRVREHPSLGPYVEDLSKLVVSSFAEIKSHIAEGNKTRTVASTDMNQTSSRSHAVFTIMLTQSHWDEQTELNSEKQSRIALVDLAGSERSSVSGTSGIRLKEGSEINRSLATLGRVISALAGAESSSYHAPSQSQSQSQTNTGQPSSAQTGNGISKKKQSTSLVPYRDSTLTWLLKDSLGGNSMTTMVATISPSPSSWDQTLSTLRFADSAKRIKNQAVVNEDPNAKLIRELKQELETLKKTLSEQQNNDTIGNNGNNDSINARSEKNDAAVVPIANRYRSESLKDQMLASEKLLADVNQTWEQRLMRTQQIQQQREKSLEELGVSLDDTGIGVHTPKKIPHLVNLSDDPLLAECLVYNIKAGRTHVSHAESDIPGIRLQGEFIKSPHCTFINTANKVTLVPNHSGGANVTVDGIQISDAKVLHSGYRIILGGTHVFRFNHPQEALEHRRRTSMMIHSSPLAAESPTNTNIATSTPTPTSSTFATSAYSYDFSPSTTPDWGRSSPGGASLNKVGNVALDKPYQEGDRERVSRAAWSESATSSTRPETPPSLFSSPSSLVQSPSSRQQRKRSSMLSDRAKTLSPTMSMSSDDGEYNKSIDDMLEERKELARRIFRQWKGQKLMLKVDAVIRLASLIRKAQAISDELQSTLHFQLLVVDKQGYKPFFADGNGMWEELESSCGDGCSITPQSNEHEQICVRVADFAKMTVRIWSIRCLRKRLRQASNLAIQMKSGGNLGRKIVTLENPFENEGNTGSLQEYTFVGYCAMSTLFFSRAERASCEVISPYTHSVCGIAVFSLKNSRTQLSVDIQGFQPEEMTAIYVSINNETSQTIEIDDNGYGEIALDKQQQEQLAEGDSNHTTGRLNFRLFAKVTKQYLDKLVSWDEMQEPGLDKASLRNEKGWDVSIRTRCLELDEKGGYSATDILRKNNSDYILLHHGLQRRVEFEVLCPEPLFKDVAHAKIGDVRLVDQQGIIHESGCNDVVLRQVTTNISSSRSPQTQGKIHERHGDFHSFKLEFQWDTSGHHCVFLDRNTRDGNKVLVAIELALTCVSGNQVVLKFDSQVIIRPRVSSVSKWDTMLGKVVLLKWVMSYFVLEKRAAVPRCLNDFSKMAPSKDDDFRPRGVSILREYYRCKERYDLQLQIQDYRGITMRTTPVATPKINLNADDYEKLDDVIKLWKRRHIYTVDKRLQVWDYREKLIPVAKNDEVDVEGTEQEKFLFIPRLVMKPSKVDIKTTVLFAHYPSKDCVNVSVETLEWQRLLIELRANYIYLYNYETSLSASMCEVASINLFHWSLESICDAAFTKRYIVRLKYGYDYYNGRNQVEGPGITATSDSTNGGSKWDILINFQNSGDHQEFLLLCNRQLNGYHDTRYI